MSFVQRLNGWIRSVPAWSLYMLGAALPIWLFWQGATGGLGADPVKGIERPLGLWALRLIVLGLAVTPLRRFAGLNLMKFRRAIGVVAFSYVLLHFLTWIVLDMGLLFAQALGDVVKRPYITVGMAAMLLLLPLWLSSNNRAVRWLGAARWQRLHRLVYPAAILGGVHYFWLVKAWPLSPVLYLAAILSLLACRAIPRRRINANPMARA